VLKEEIYVLTVEKTVCCLNEILHNMYTVTKFLFPTALRRIFAALVMEKPCLSTGAFFPAHIALF